MFTASTTFRRLYFHLILAALLLFSILGRARAQGYIHQSFVGTLGQYSGTPGMAVDINGNIFVVDDNIQIAKFDSNGNLITKFGGFGTDIGQFILAPDATNALAVDSSGNVYVADFENNRIVRFDNNGTFLLPFGSPGIDIGQFDGPSAVAVDRNGNIFVVDSGNNRIQKFDSFGIPLTQFGKGQFADLEYSCIAVDSNGNVFVSDSFDQRIVKFDNNGNFITQFGSPGSGIGQFIFPQGVAIDSHNNVYVADDYSERIEKFDNNGNYISQCNTRNIGTFAVAIDGNDNIIADTSDIEDGIKKYRPVFWGARVKLTMKTGATIIENLAFLENSAVTFLDNLSLDATGNVAMDSNTIPIPVSEIASIQVYPDRFDPKNFDGGPPEPGFNKYIVNGMTPTGTSGVRAQSIRTVHLDGFANGAFVYRVNSIGVGDNNTPRNEVPNALYAIPRSYTTHPADIQIEGWLTGAAQSINLDRIGASKVRRLPPQILYAKAWRESSWKQFGFTTNALGLPVNDPSGQESTLVTYDGGVGIAQINDINIILAQSLPPAGDATGGTRPPNLGIPTHLWFLASDVEYNIQAGAYLLCKMRRHPAMAGSMPGQPGRLSESTFENWFLSVQRYNNGNDTTFAYAAKIWASIEQPAPRLLAVGIQGVALSVPVGTQKPSPGQAPTTIHPSPDFPFPATADTDFDGTADVRLEVPTITPVADGYELSVMVTTLPGGKALTALKVSIGRDVATKYALQKDSSDPNRWFVKFSTLPIGSRRFYLNGEIQFIQQEE